MELDPITYFLQVANGGDASVSGNSPNSSGAATTPPSSSSSRTKKLALSVFVNIHSRLSILQMNKGFISYDDLLQCLSLTFGSSVMDSSGVTNPDVLVYAGIIYEASFKPAMLNKGPSFVLDRAMVGNEANFLKSVLDVLVSHNGGITESTVVEELKAEIITFLKNSGYNTERLQPTSSSSATGALLDNLESRYNQLSLSAASDGGRSGNTSAYSSNQNFSTAPSSLGMYSNNSPVNTPISGGSSFPRAPSYGKPPPPPAEEDSLSEEARALLNAGMEIEKNEPILRLLAHIRKAGMDILFPQIIHDKVLMSIFVSMRCAHSLAHRELIDVVMAVKEARAITQLDNVSRTKVRGVLALLKHAQMFITHGEEGEAVRLHLTPAIASFRDLREKHDAFVNRCILQHHLFIPNALKGELIWQLDNDTKELRLQELKGLESSLENFLSSGPGAAVLAPFLAAAKNVQIPTTLPPSMQASMHSAHISQNSNSSSLISSSSVPANNNYSNPPRAYIPPNTVQHGAVGSSAYSTVIPPPNNIGQAGRQYGNPPKDEYSHYYASGGNNSIPTNNDLYSGYALKRSNVPDSRQYSAANTNLGSQNSWYGNNSNVPPARGQQPAYSATNTSSAPYYSSSKYENDPRPSFYGANTVPVGYGKSPAEGSGSFFGAAVGKYDPYSINTNSFGQPGGSRKGGDSFFFTDDNEPLSQRRFNEDFRDKDEPNLSASQLAWQNGPVSAIGPPALDPRAHLTTTERHLSSATIDDIVDTHEDPTSNTLPGSSSNAIDLPSVPSNNGLKDDAFSR